MIMMIPNPQTLDHLWQNLVLQTRRSTHMQMNARWEALSSVIPSLGSPYHQSRIFQLATFAPNIAFLLASHYPLSIQEILCKIICLIQIADQGCVAGATQVGVNFDHDKFSYINVIISNSTQL